MQVSGYIWGEAGMDQTNNLERYYTQKSPYKTCTKKSHRVMRYHLLYIDWHCFGLQTPNVDVLSAVWREGLPTSLEPL